MGLYDIIYVWDDCPVCGEFRKFELQTKQLSNTMATYEPVENLELLKCLLANKEKPSEELLKIDETWKLWYYSDYEKRDEILNKAYVGDQFNYIEGITTCDSTRCRWDAQRRDILSQSCVSGFGRLISAKVLCYKGYLYGRMVEKKPEHLDEKELSKYEEKITGIQRANYDYLLKRFDNKSIALEYMSYGIMNPKSKEGKVTNAVRELCKEW